MNAMHKKLTFLILMMFFAVLSVKAQEAHKYGAFSSQTSTAQERLEKKRLLKVYPVPATTQIIFKFKNSGDINKTYEIIVYNFLGKVVDKIAGFQNSKTLSLKDYYSGIYIYQLRDKQGQLIESGKFNVVKQ